MTLTRLWKKEPSGIGDQQEEGQSHILRAQQLQRACVIGLSGVGACLKDADDGRCVKVEHFKASDDRQLRKTG